MEFIKLCKSSIIFRYIFSYGTLFVVLILVWLESNEDAVVGSYVRDFLGIGDFDDGKMALSTLPLIGVGLYLIYLYFSQKKYIKLSIVAFITGFVFITSTVFSSLSFVTDTCFQSRYKESFLCNAAYKMYSLYIHESNQTSPMLPAFTIPAGSSEIVEVKVIQE